MGWLQSLARLARMAGAALVRNNGSMHGRLQQVLSLGEQLAPAALLLMRAACCRENGAGPGADPSAAAHGLAWLLESTGKVALCQGWFLPPRHFISSDKTQRPKVPVFYKRVYAMQCCT